MRRLPHLSLHQVALGLELALLLVHHHLLAQLGRVQLLVLGLQLGDVGLELLPLRLQPLLQPALLLLHLLARVGELALQACDVVMVLALRVLGFRLALGGAGLLVAQGLPLRGKIAFK